MPDFLALDWDSRQLSGVVAQVSRGSVRIRQTFTLDWPSGEQLSPESAPGTSRNRESDQRERAETAHQRGTWLRERLQQLGIGTRQTLICLPRELAVVRQLEIPDVAAGEMPDLVRLQAETKMTSSLDKQTLDFLPLPKRAGQTTREILVAMIPRETTDTISATAMAAGLEVSAIGLNPAATTELVSRLETRRHLDPNETSLVLSRHGQRLEISLVRNGHLLFTHSAQLAGESESQNVKAILAEINRSSVALERILNGEKLSRAWIVGTQVVGEVLSEALRSRLSCDVNTLEPVADLGITVDEEIASVNDVRFAGPIGMLLAESGAATETIDFLNPRKAVKRIGKQTLRIAVIAAVAAGLFLIVGVSLIVYNSILAGELRDKRAKNIILASKVRQGKPTLDAAKAIGQWDRRNIRWPDQFEELNRALPGTDRIYMTEFQFIPPRGKNLSRIKGIGYAIERADVELLKQQLSDMGYRVNPTAVKDSQKDPKYKIRFELDLDLIAIAKEPAEKSKEN